MAPSSCDLPLLQRWLTGWSRSRGVALPVADGGGLRVDVGWPDQLRRHVFVDAGAALQACAASIRDPYIVSDPRTPALPADSRLCMMRSPGSVGDEPGSAV